MFLAPLFKLMADKQASDLYFVTGAPINIKILAVARPVNQQILDAETIKQVAYEIMSKEQIAAFESRRELNFSYRVPDLGSFRVNMYRQKGDTGMVIRHIKGKIPSVEELKLPLVLKDLAMEKRGLILVVGASGSGKSTTLAAMIEHRNGSKSGHILTVEDPIEYQFKHNKSIVSQREVGIDSESYSTALMNAMRQAPDMLMIGECLDQETFRQSLIYAQTGHLCLSTLHANNSHHALSRIINFFPHDARPGLLADLAVSLRCVVSQRLVRGIDGQLIPAVEVLLNSTSIAELIKTGELGQIKDAMEQSLSPGSQTFEQALFKLYKAGKVSLEEALTNADSPTNLSSIINYSKTQGERVEQTVTSTQPGVASKDLSNFTFNIDVV